ncbi:MAG: alpha/beta hydrolase [Pseudomonas sp.]|nr:alpha/beta hydrolase [Pseudomonas sp.]
MSLMPVFPSRLLRPLLLGVALASLAACSSDPDKDAPTFVSVQDYLKTAYQPTQHFTFDGSSTRWAWGTHQVDVSLLVPSGQKNLPVILYLPGLGEGVDDGVLWRQSWADAGYAVLTVQALRDDHSIYDSADAQAGAFRMIAAKAFDPAALNERVVEVDRVLTEVRRRGKAGEAGYNALDLDRLVVAGYDLGAQTAAALAGEHAPDKARAVTWKPQAAILLSPYVPGGADPARFAQIDTPLLSVTGPQDEDTFSWVATARQRLALYQNLSVPGSYQLTLDEANHKGLSGTIAKAEGGKGSKPERPKGDGPQGGGPGGPGGEGWRAPPRQN